ncbi:MAG: hypothetical protein OEZ09_01675 [Betaproteobacteria bacterium]|nr:hypothetical protein [Betaproteobacteria bacterium]MDH4323080.1 hypothetical protein [Betaproteobacteria bacterium]MDH5211350.1 hypothetical protein [Betaproteobacteria bacterium]MDH5577142.1 hypothetical protein [Betaproteobacteria bacterium]
MTLETTRAFLGWCTLINYGVLVVWFLVFLFARDWVHKLHTRWFRLPAAHFDAIHYAGMGLYKLGIFLFNLAPYIALRIVG